MKKKQNKNTTQYVSDTTTHKQTNTFNKHSLYNFVEMCTTQLYRFEWIEQEQNFDLSKYRMTRFTLSGINTIWLKYC
jgi:hypothetical protein